MLVSKMARKKNKVIDWTINQVLNNSFYRHGFGDKVTAYISRIKTDWLRQIIWLLWYPAFVWIPLWWRFRYSKNYVSLQVICWDLGWNGVKFE